MNARVRRGVLHRGYIIAEARHGGWKVRSGRHGIEVTETSDGRVAIVTWPTATDAIAAIDMTFIPPSMPED